MYVCHLNGPRLRGSSRTTVRHPQENEAPSPVTSAWPDGSPCAFRIFPLDKSKQQRAPIDSRQPQGLAMTLDALSKISPKTRRPKRILGVWRFRISFCLMRCMQGNLAIPRSCLFRKRGLAQNVDRFESVVFRRPSLQVSECVSVCLCVEATLFAREAGKAQSWKFLTHSANFTASSGRIASSPW